MLSLILGVSGAANILLALLYKHRCENEKRNKDSLLDDLGETKRCYHKTTEKVRELEKSCFEKETEIVELGEKIEDIGMDLQISRCKVEELKDKVRKANRAIDKQASIMKVMHSISREIRDDKEALRLRNIDLERKLGDTRTLLGYKEEELKKSDNIKQGALETLKGFLSMNREDRRTFAKSGMIPADLIKFDKELMEEVE